MPAKDANYTQQAVKIQYNLLENIHRIHQMTARKVSFKATHIGGIH